MKYTRFLATTALALMTGSALAESLTVYSPQGGERGAWIAEQAKAGGHDIELLNAAGGELFDRLIAEKNNPQADVVLGMIDSSMALLKGGGVVPSLLAILGDGFAGSAQGQGRHRSQILGDADRARL